MRLLCQQHEGNLFTFKRWAGISYWFQNASFCVLINNCRGWEEKKNSALAKHAADRDKRRGGVWGGWPIPPLFHCVPPQIWLILLGSLLIQSHFIIYAHTYTHTKGCMLPLLLVVPLLGRKQKLIEINELGSESEWLHLRGRSDVDYKCRESERENVATLMKRHACLLLLQKTSQCLWSSPKRHSPQNPKNCLHFEVNEKVYLKRKAFFNSLITFSQVQMSGNKLVLSFIL